MTSNEEKKRIVEDLITSLQYGTEGKIDEEVYRNQLSQALDSYRESVVGELRGKITKIYDVWASEPGGVDFAAVGLLMERIKELLPPNKETE